MKFFYIGSPAPSENKVLQSYDQYQDSSLWVPSPDIDGSYNPLERPWYLAGQKAGKNSVIFTEPYAERRTKEAITSGATSIWVEGVQGSLAAGISIKPIIDEIIELFADDSYLIIFSKGADKTTQFVSTVPKYIYSSRNDKLGEQFKAYNDAESIKDRSNYDIMKLYEFTQNSKSGVLEWKVGDETRLFAYNTVPEVGWKVFNSVSSKKALSVANSLDYQNAIIALLGLVLLVVVTYIIVKIAMRPVEVIGKELRELARTGDLTKRISIVGNNEAGRIARAINDMLDNTAGPVKKLGDTAQKIAEGNFNLEIDIAGKGDVMRLVNSFNDMTQQLVELHKSMRDASPLTGLPGGIAIETFVQSKLDAKSSFVFCMFDLDSFKPFNDHYGYNQGNLVILHTAKIIKEAVEEFGTEEDFLGHIGGDDFALITHKDCYERICQTVIDKFMLSINSFYASEDRVAGKIISKDRAGKVKHFPIMTISICALSSTELQFNNYAHIGKTIAELKKYAKSLDGSNLIVDRRKK